MKNITGLMVLYPSRTDFSTDENTHQEIWNEHSVELTDKLYKIKRTKICIGGIRLWLN